jgi:uncharacterized protein (TIGR02646 family)
MKGPPASFDRTLYAAKSVKNALITAQHEKCAFCESKLTHVAWGDVEHFRPKAGWRQAAADPLTTPGYYWLAYEWENLSFCCQLCNQRGKRNRFPLADPGARATGPAAVANEQPLFVDPYSEDPESHITFNGALVHALDSRGSETREGLDLDRPELVERRKERLDHLVALRDGADALERKDPTRPEIARMRALLARAVDDDAEYAGMARAALR